MDALEVVLMAVGVVAGATLQSAIGFGFALVAGPAVFAVVTPAEAITILIALGTVLNLLVVLAERRPSAVDRREAVQLLTIAVPGVVAGVFILVALSKPTLQVIVGACVIVAAAIYTRNASAEPSAGNPLARAVAGLAAGTLTTTTATTGPPLVLFLQSKGVKPEAFRDTMAALLLGLNVMGAIALLLAGGRAELPDLAILAVLAGMVVVGRSAGRILFDRFDHNTFRVAGLTLIVVSGVASIVAGLSAIA
jgi:uncharacterized membrane protein YfcA